MNPRRCRLACSTSLAAVAICWAAPAIAQTGTVRGTVRGTGGEIPDSALVTVLDVEGATLVSQPSGEFEISLAPGNYTLVVRSGGYETQALYRVEIIAGEVNSVAVTMESSLDPDNRTVIPGQSQPTSSSAAPVHIVRRDRLREWSGPTLVDALRHGLPGVDVAQTGLMPANVVGRGFNNVFSGALLTLTDYRYARLPSLRLNAHNMIPTTTLDVERIEIVLGPTAALYGPNSANGVMHIITSSPIDRPGTDVSVSGGERDSYQGVLRHAARLSERLGFKLSGQYFRGQEWEYVDPVEEASGGRRDFDTQRFSGDARVDFRPWGLGGGEIVLTGGMNQIDGIELTPLGAGQVKDWRYEYGHARFQKDGWFAQAFLNRTNAPDTRLLRTNGLLVDRSRAMAAQTRYTFQTDDDQEWVLGLDYQRTEPRTDSTITGREEDDDVYNEFGGYVHSRTRLSDQADFVAAVRVDKHDRLRDANVSPRLAFLFRPGEGHNIRVTYNQAFNTPTTNNLFLDLVSTRIPLGGDFGYDVRAIGTPPTGLTYRERCDGGLYELCMYSTFAPTMRLAADGALAWDGVLELLAAADSSLAPILPLLMNPGADPADPALISALLSLDQQSETFVPVGRPQDIPRLRSSSTNTVELGYYGLFADKLAVTVDVYSTSIRDYIGPFRVETPSVFLTVASIEDFVKHRLAPQLASGVLTDEEATAIVETIAQLPLGTVAPDQRTGNGFESTDILIVSRNFGDLDLWGADLGLKLQATDEVLVTGSLSYISEKCFDFNDDGACASTVDIALNAPSTKGSLGFRYASADSPISLGARMRYVGGFPMNSGAFIGDVDPYTLFDAHLAFRPPGLSGTTVSVVANNLLDKRHQEFIGAPFLGRYAFVRLDYSF